jgi:hypothetical protein
MKPKIYSIISSVAENIWLKSIYSYILLLNDSNVQYIVMVLINFLQF